ncbi:hypothetical protein CAPTEDRAFT_198031 [Capitella teleta]|uniref:Major facilitator superfamily (MFS) profile domain-containing protein n=1 Tax=Capitella teleta TaxID=283909 RepID=R7U8K5_CAPTE|nr:hypothetical protein CAPTEDRAFT_198031 [Capitella teleta]|eukprot:ELU02436.1 hypothetical protein CAPTEDRAFT_198031 [Capitella teleta]
MGKPEAKLRGAFTDSWFAWLISVMSFCTFYALSANVVSLGVILPEFLDHLQVSQAMIGLLGSIKIATFDLTAGFASAGLYIPSNVIVHQYHNKRRALASSLASVGLSFSSFTFPVFMRLTIQNFGWRAALVMLASIQAQMVAAAMMFMPNPDLHVKPPPTQMDEQDRGIEQKKSEDVIIESTNVKACSIDASILKNPAFVFLLFAYQLASSAAIVFGSFAIQRGIFQGVDGLQASFIMSSFGACSIIGRIAAGFIGNLECTRKDMQVSGCVFMAGVIVILSIFAGSSLVLHSIFAGCFGIMNGCYNSIYTTLLVDIVGLSELPKAMGYIQLVKCVISFGSLPLAGYLFDVTQNYVATYLLVGICDVVAGVLLLCSGLANRKRKKIEAIEMKEFTDVQL